MNTKKETPRPFSHIDQRGQGELTRGSENTSVSEKYIPMTGCPRGVLSPPKVNTWEWSAVRTRSVSEGWVMLRAFLTASSRAPISSSALRPLLWWWAWSMRPADRGVGIIPRFFFFFRLNNVSITKDQNDYHYSCTGAYTKLVNFPYIISEVN